MSTTTKPCWIVDRGPIPYARACELQRQLVEARKVHVIPDILLMCEHPHVITLGRNSHRENLLAGNHTLEKMNVEVRRSDRGGDITYHGPGQIIGYPILDLTEHRRDIRWYVDRLEEVMIRTTGDFGIAAKRVEGQHGAWIETAEGERKIGALGVHLSRWVTSHGFAYNVSIDLRYFELIVPCGIPGKGVTSVERVLGRTVSVEEARERIASHFSTVFNRRLERVTRDQLAELLSSRRETAADALTSIT